MTDRLLVAFKQWFAVVAVLLLLGSYFWNELERSRDIRHNCQVIEALKAVVYADKTAQINSSERYLRTHPKGFPGVSAALIRQGIRDTQASRARFAPGKCP